MKRGIMSLSTQHENACYEEGNYKSSSTRYESACYEEGHYVSLSTRHRTACYEARNYVSSTKYESACYEEGIMYLYQHGIRAHVMKNINLNRLTEQNYFLNEL